VLGQHRRRPDEELVRLPDGRLVLAVVVELPQHVLDRLKPGPLLVVALDHRPRRLGRVGVVEHRLLGLGVVLPLVQGLDVHRAQLPLPHGVDPADDETGALLGLGHGEPELGQVQPGVDQHVLEFRCLSHEFPVVRLRREAHHPLHACPVVPRAVEHDDLARRGQMRHVTLEVPLGPLPLARLGQCHDRRPARVQVLGEALDRAALAGRVAALEDDHDPLPGGLHPVLQLHQLDLERALEVLVLGPQHLLGVRVVLSPGIDDPAVRPAQHRVVVLVVVVDGQAGQEGGIGGPVGRQRVEVGGRFAAHVSSTAHSRCEVTTGPARGVPFSRGDHDPVGCCSVPGQRVPVSSWPALQLARLTAAIPAEFLGQAELILTAAARAGADLRAPAAICGEIPARPAAGWPGCETPHARVLAELCDRVSARGGGEA
jgi:hypothetical protein